MPVHFVYFALRRHVDALSLLLFVLARKWSSLLSSFLTPPNDRSYFSTVVVVVECSYFDGMKGVVLKATTLEFRVEFRVERRAIVSRPEKMRLRAYEVASF